MALADELKKLPEETEYEFERRLTDRFGGDVDQSDEAELRRLAESKSDEKVRYGAFYALHILLRRDLDTTKLGKLMDELGDGFSEHDTYPHLRSLYLQTSAGGEPAEALHCAREAHRTVKEHAGILHSLAVALIAVEEQKDEPDPKRLEEAQQTLESAISRSQAGYAKYFATQARLLSLQNQHGEAKRAIAKAIDKEDSKRDDYAVRVGEYQAIKLQIQSREHSEILDRRVDSALAQFEQSRLEMVQLLGLLAAIVAFLVVTLEIARVQPLDEAVRLLSLMTGSILIVFAAFGFVIYSRRWFRPLVVLALGLGVAAYALYGWQSID